MRPVSPFASLKKRCAAVLFPAVLAALVPLQGWAQEKLTAGVRETATPANPDRPTPLSSEARGDIFMARKMYREAIETYQLDKKPNSVVLNKIGIAFHQTGDLNTAERYYQKAIKNKGDYAEAINNLGTIQYAKRSYRRAVSTYKKALKYSPNSASIQSNLGTAWFARKKYAEAMECYEKAMALDPDVFEHRSIDRRFAAGAVGGRESKIPLLPGEGLRQAGAPGPGAAVHPKVFGRGLQGTGEVYGGIGVHATPGPARI